MYACAGSGRVGLHVGLAVVCCLFDFQVGDDFCDIHASRAGQCAMLVPVRSLGATQ